MLLILVVSLYTSRIVLQALGEDDFGIYNIVGGIVILFTFINSAMATGTQRHLSYELGKENGDVPAIFSACFRIHLWLALVILVLAETVGLWFLNTKMNFPEGRMEVVNWIYQCSIISCLIGIILTPLTAAIISYERMSFYAYLSILEVFLKLAVVFILQIILVDKLLLYAALLTGISIIVFFANVLYCRQILPEIRFKKVKNSTLYRKLLSFSSWSLFGSLANVGYQQGINIIINLFFGVGLNAAVGIANQINGAVSQFVSGFQQALNPQLVQSEALKDRNRQIDLIYKSSKFSYFIMFLISFPLMVNVACVLSIWLGNYPQHTAAICNLILISILISCLSGPLWVTIYATGKIKAYQIVVSSIALSIIPITYIGGLFGMPPEQMFMIRASNYVFVLAVQLLFLRRYISLCILSYSKMVLFPVVVVSMISIVFYIILQKFMPSADSLWSLIYQTAIYVFVMVMLIWFIGLNRTERQNVVNIVFSKLQIRNK